MSQCDAADAAGHAPSPDRATPAAAECLRCRAAPATVHLRVPLCATCFAGAVRSRFRAALSEPKRLTRNERVVVAVSGGLGSRVLLRLLHDAVAGTDGFARRREIDVAAVVHVDDSVLEIGTPAPPLDVAALAAPTGWPVDVVPMDAAYGGDRARLLGAVAAAQTLSAKEDLVAMLRNQLLREVARRHACTVVLTGETTDTLAARVLTLISLGRGATVAHEVGVLDRRFDVHVLRPVRDVSRAELRLFAEQHGVPALERPPLLSPARNSIARVTDDFVSGLQRDFPSTLDSVLRTADKVQAPAMSDAPGARCVLCLSLRLADASERRESTVARQAAPACEDCACGSACHPTQTLLDRVRAHVCYACITLLRELTPDAAESALPPHVAERLAAAEAAQRSEALREQIRDFLLD